MTTSGLNHSEDEVEAYSGEVVSTPKRIETLEDAARYAYGVSETRKKIQEIVDVAAGEISKWEQNISEVREWADSVITPLQEKLDYFNMLLTQYHSKEFNEAPNEKAQAKLKSIKLPYGITLSSRQPAVALEVTDDVALTVYAIANDMVDLPPAKPRWSEIKKTLSADEQGVVKNDKGQVIEFVQAVTQDRKFEVK